MQYKITVTTSFVDNEGEIIEPKIEKYFDCLSDTVAKDYAGEWIDNNYEHWIDQVDQNLEKWNQKTESWNTVLQTQTEEQAQ